MGRPSMRGRIVEAALEQFHTLGYNAAGVKVITDAAGVPKGSFYNHFDSKETLAVEALRQYGDGLLDALHGDADPVARLRAHFEGLRDDCVGHDYRRGCLLGNFGAEIGDHSDVIRESVRQGFAHWSAALAATIEEARRGGSVRADLDAATVAGFLLTAWEGTLIRARAEQSSTAFDTFFSTVFGPLLTAA
ncbi:TetR/AcrR family transcriptional regulator [Nonomuraea maritima]|uniref:TetR/AcrR family transcriptional regulator n=1 Tax=Nonomuraea maritima TaxID=683260 RepID=UPI003722C678